MRTSGPLLACRRHHQNRLRPLNRIARVRNFFKGTERDTTSRQHKTHNTQLCEVVYPWHPWCGQKPLTCEPIARHEAVFRCGAQHGKDARLLEIPQWMFERASCCLMRLARSPLVGVEHLRQLHELLHAAAASPLLEDQHRPFKKKGDADAQKLPSQERVSIGSVSAVTPDTDLGQSVAPRSAKSRRDARANAPRRASATNTGDGQEGGRP